MVVRVWWTLGVGFRAIMILGLFWGDLVLVSCFLWVFLRCARGPPRPRRPARAVPAARPRGSPSGRAPNAPEAVGTCRQAPTLPPRTAAAWTDQVNVFGLDKRNANHHRKESRMKNRSMKHIHHLKRQLRSFVVADSALGFSGGAYGAQSEKFALPESCHALSAASVFSSKSAVAAAGLHCVSPPSLGGPASSPSLPAYPPSYHSIYAPSPSIGHPSLSTSARGASGGRWGEGTAGRQIGRRGRKAGTATEKIAEPSPGGDDKKTELPKLRQMEFSER